MKKEHFLNFYYQRLSISKKINLKAYFIEKLSFNYSICEFELLCITE